MEITESEIFDRVEPTYARALGTKNGVVEFVGIEQFAPESPDGVDLVSSVVSDASPVVGTEAPDIKAGGKGESVTDAMNAAFGETMERYCYLFPPPDALEYASYEEMRDRGRTVDYEYIDIYDRESLEEHRAGFDRQTELPWVEGTDLVTGNGVYLPAERVWQRTGVLADIDTHLPGTSNGLAAGPSLRYSLVNSMYEVVERDGVMAAWYRQQTPASIETSSLAGRCPEVHEYVTQKLENDALSVHLFDCDTFVDVPTVGAAATFGEDEFPAFVHGSGSHLDPAKTIRQAATEAAQGLPYVYHLLLDRGTTEVPPDVQDSFESNVLHYSSPRRSDDLRFYFEGPEKDVDDVYPSAEYPSVDGLSVDEQYETLVRAFADAGATPIAFELTTRDAARLGIRVTKVVVPELVPIGSQVVPPTEHPRIEDDVATKRPHPLP